MKKDPIVEEVRKIRDKHAKKFGYDLKKIVADFKQSEGQRQTTAKKVAEPSVPYSAKKR